MKDQQSLGNEAQDQGNRSARVFAKIREGTIDLPFVARAVITSSSALLLPEDMPTYNLI